MSETAQVQLAAPPTVTETSRPASRNDERGRTHGLALVFWLLEQHILVLLAIPTVAAALVTLIARGGAWTFALTWLAVPILGVLAPLAFLVYRSHQHDDGAADWSGFLHWRDESEGARWQGRKIPMETLYEAYIAGKLDFKGDLHETLLHRNRLFRFCFTWGDVKFYFRQFLKQNVQHSVESDRGDIAHVYNRGNDFYNWFLGDTMIYTSGIFQDRNESLEDAQRRKLETVCKYVQMKPGDKHLDIGCGWGALLVHATSQHGTVSTGITLAQEQADWAHAAAQKAGVADRLRIIVDDYRNLPSEKYDKITCLEMAEHVGIRRAFAG